MIEGEYERASGRTGELASDPIRGQHYFTEPQCQTIRRSSCLPRDPRRRAVVERDEEWTSTCYIKEYPLVVARGQGVMVEDVDGNRYLDFMAGIAVSSTGYGHPKVVAAVKDAADRFLHICGSDFYYEGMAALCERLARIAPGSSQKRVFLTNSGTEAVEGAIKLARYATRRTAIIAFRGAFHGRTTGAVSLTSSKARQHAGFGPLLPDVHHVPFAYRYRCQWCADKPECTRGCLDVIEKDLFARHLDPHDVAAIFVEPIQGEGGYIVPPPGWLRDLRAMCDKYGILLVADEVQSGVGRTGKMWACDHEGVEPDILLTAKGLGSGHADRRASSPRSRSPRGRAARTARPSAAIPSAARRRSRRSTWSRAGSWPTPSSWASGCRPACGSWRRSTAASATSAAWGS